MARILLFTPASSLAPLGLYLPAPLAQPASSQPASQPASQLKSYFWIGMQNQISKGIQEFEAEAEQVDIPKMLDIKVCRCFGAAFSKKSKVLEIYKDDMF